MDALLDPDYFLKAVDQCLKNRFGFSEREMLRHQQERQDAQTQARQEFRDKLTQLGSCDKITYLEKTVYPVLYPGLTMLDRERPEDPLMALSVFLLQNKNLCDSPANLLYTGSEEDQPPHISVEIGQNQDITSHAQKNRNDDEGDGNKTGETAAELERLNQNNQHLLSGESKINNQNDFAIRSKSRKG